MWRSLRWWVVIWNTVIKNPGLENAIQYDENHPRPDVLAIYAMKKVEIKKPSEKKSGRKHKKLLPHLNG